MAKLTQEEVKKLTEKLDKKQYEVTQLQDTEAPFTGELLNNKETGMYKCVVCGQELFSSDTKYESGSGWPSFHQAVDDDRIELVRDTSHNMVRTEVKCSNCGAHLGHVFDYHESDNRPDQGYFCINSAALDFKKESN